MCIRDSLRMASRGCLILTSSPLIHTLPEVWALSLIHIFLYTYRDPHLRESYDTFADAPAALAARDYTARDLDEFIVGLSLIHI